MANSEHAQLAIEWVNDPSQCAVFLEGLIQEFESLFTLDGGTDMKGMGWATVETTTKHRFKLAVNLSSQIVLARKALTLCNEQKSDMFRLDPEWQSAFSNLEKTLIHRNVLGVIDRRAVPDAEDKLAEAFLAFARVANNLNDRIAVSIAVSTVPAGNTTKGKRKNLRADRIPKDIWKQHNYGPSRCDERVPPIDFIEQRMETDPVTREILAMDETAMRGNDPQSQEQELMGQMMTIMAVANQIFRPVTMFDHGIDGEVEFKDNDGKASGKRIYIQLKSGNSYLRKRKGDGREVFDVKNDRHLEYWINQPVDVYLVIRQTDEMRGDGTIRWMNVTHYLKDRKDKKSRQIIFDGEKLDMEAVYKVRDGFFPS